MGRGIVGSGVAELKSFSAGSGVLAGFLGDCVVQVGGLIFESLCGVLKDLGYFFLRDSSPQMVGVIWALELPSRPAHAL